MMPILQFRKLRLRKAKWFMLVSNGEEMYSFLYPAQVSLIFLVCLMPLETLRILTNEKGLRDLYSGTWIPNAPESLESDIEEPGQVGLWSLDSHFVNKGSDDSASASCCLWGYGPSLVRFWSKEAGALNFRMKSIGWKIVLLSIPLIWSIQGRHIRRHRM